MESEREDNEQVGEGRGEGERELGGCETDR